MIKDIINELSGHVLYVTGISALELHNYSVHAELLETANTVHHELVKCMDGCIIPARYLERVARYNNNVYILGIYDVLCMLILRWRKEDIRAIKDSGVLDDISTSRLVHILNREVDKSTKEFILGRYASIIGSE